MLENYDTSHSEKKLSPQNSRGARRKNTEPHMEIFKDYNQQNGNGNGEVDPKKQTVIVIDQNFNVFNGNGQ